MAQRPLIGIITNCEPVADYRFPGYLRDTINDDYPRAIAAAGGVPLLLPPLADTSLAADQLAACDGLLLAGGPDINPLRYGQQPRRETEPPMGIRDAHEWAALDWAFANSMPILGICRGMQVLNVWLGGTLHQDVSHTGSTLRHDQGISPAEATHEISVVPGSFLHTAIGATSAWVNSFHHQGLDQLATGLSAVATAPDGLVEAIELTAAPAGREHPGTLIAGVQWHPEMMCPTDSKAVALFDWFLAEVSERTNS